MSTHDTSSAPGPTPGAAPHHPLHERSDEWIATILGRDLQGGMIRAILYVLIVGLVLATLAALIG